MHEKLEKMACQNEQMLIRAEQVWYFLPAGFCDEIRKLTTEIICLQQSLT